MSEAEFNLLLDAVCTAIANESEDEFAPTKRKVHAAPQAANDNGSTDWPLVPFPDGWYGAC
jgi:hypothetical protein